MTLAWGIGVNLRQSRGRSAALFLYFQSYVSDWSCCKHDRSCRSNIRLTSTSHIYLVYLKAKLSTFESGERSRMIFTLASNHIDIMIYHCHRLSFLSLLLHVPFASLSPLPHPYPSGIHRSCVSRVGSIHPTGVLAVTLTWSSVMFLTCTSNSIVYRPTGQEMHGQALPPTL
jgi:hypothetical protein